MADSFKYAEIKISDCFKITKETGLWDFTAFKNRTKYTWPERPTSDGYLPYQTIASEKIKIGTNRENLKPGDLITAKKLLYQQTISGRGNFQCVLAEFVYNRERKEGFVYLVYEKETYAEKIRGHVIDGRGMKNVITLPSTKGWIELVIKDSNGNIFSNLKYKLILKDNTERTGVTNQEGYLREEKIPKGGFSLVLGDNEYTIEAINEI